MALYYRFSAFSESHFYNKITIFYRTKVTALQQVYSALFAISAHFVRPHAYLDFSDVGFSKEEHAQTALTDTAAHREAEFSVQEALVELKVCPLRTAALFKLEFEAFRAYTDTH